MLHFHDWASFSEFRDLTEAKPTQKGNIDHAWRVTVAGKHSDDLAPGTLKSIAKQSGLTLP